MRRLQLSSARQALAASRCEFVEPFRHGSLTVEIFKPDRIDRQQPHTRVEVDVDPAGTGTFKQAGERIPFEPGEVLFVPAGGEHHFEDFSSDFVTWAFFYGPKGGEPQA